jgi:hypothetical protein
MIATARKLPGVIYLVLNEDLKFEDFAEDVPAAAFPRETVGRFGAFFHRRITSMQFQVQS